jgi:hypothetical protein
MPSSNREHYDGRSQDVIKFFRAMQKGNNLPQSIQSMAGHGDAE